MNTFVIRTARQVFRSTALFGLAALLAGTPAALAGNDRGKDPVAGEMKAVAYATSSLNLKVNFENPAREKVTLSILNASGQVLFTSNLGHDEIYNGKLDLSGLADGKYTVTLQTKSSRYEKPFQIQTQTARTAVVQ
ncbi:MAG TPA: T9SS type A sorting domain-containing protein [Cytophagales bacterium]